MLASITYYYLNLHYQHAWTEIKPSSHLYCSAIDVTGSGPPFIINSTILYYIFINCRPISFSRPRCVSKIYKLLWCPIIHTK
ncbi:hypothetical protein OIU77_021622 [Salix suchowensis]|uniref:Uncharacterized protein n=1 Tax=Salix suchowensis TaxID=1278906 RepID=A0ABQ9CDF8_9ROSI|nr:hypothetical protein OIU77_021622 [Salix suchowensis]